MFVLCSIAPPHDDLTTATEADLCSYIVQHDFSVNLLLALEEASSYKEY